MLITSRISVSQIKVSQRWFAKVLILAFQVGIENNRTEVLLTLLPRWTSESCIDIKLTLLSHLFVMTQNFKLEGIWRHLKNLSKLLFSQTTVRSSPPKVLLGVPKISNKFTEHPC